MNKQINTYCFFCYSLVLQTVIIIFVDIESIEDVAQAFL